MVFLQLIRCLEVNIMLMYRLQADFASGVVSTVHPGIVIFSGCSPALLRELAVRWKMIISPPSEPVLISGSFIFRYTLMVAAEDAIASVAPSVQVHP